MWYVEYLLLNREVIREKGDLDSPEYDDLLSVDMALEKLIKAGLVSDSELLVLDKIINLEDFKIVLSRTENKQLHNDTVTRLFVGLCNKISTILGGIFTDAGYLTYLQNKYNLNEEQLKRLEKYMLSNFRHKLMTVPYTQKEI